MVFCKLHRWSRLSKELLPPFLLPSHPQECSGFERKHTHTHMLVRVYAHMGRLFSIWTMGCILQGTPVTLAWMIARRAGAQHGRQQLLPGCEDEMETGPQRVCFSGVVTPSRDISPVLFATGLRGPVPWHFLGAPQELPGPRSSAQHGLHGPSASASMVPQAPHQETWLTARASMLAPYCRFRSVLTKLSIPFPPLPLPSSPYSYAYSYFW